MALWYGRAGRLTTLFGGFRHRAVRNVLDTSDQVRQAAQRTRDAERPDKPKKRKKKKRKAALLKLGSSIKVASINGQASAGAAEGRA